MKTTALLLLAALPFAASPALSQDLPPGLDAAALLPGWTEPDGTRVLALDLQLSPGWKTYWRNPGDAGIPASFDWGGSTNLGEVTYLWPTPEVIDSGGIRSIGYHDELVLPIRITPADPEQPVDLRTTIDFGLCETICVPGHLELTAPEPEAEPDPRIKAALLDAPKPIGPLANCKVSDNDDGIRVSATVPAKGLSPDAVAAMEITREGVWVSEPETQRTGDDLTAESDMVDETGQPFRVTPDQIRVTVIDGENAIEFDGCPVL